MSAFFIGYQCDNLTFLTEYRLVFVFVEMFSSNCKAIC